MNQSPSMGEVRPTHAAESRLGDFKPPLLRLRSGYRPPITPETCLVRHCPICAWRREGLLETTGASTPVVRETDPSDYCPGCNAWLDCRCPDPAHLDAHVEASYALGHKHGLADGPEHRPTRRWVVEAGLDLAYLGGYDAACAGVPPPAPVPLHLGRLWEPFDDGLPW